MKGISLFSGMGGDTLGMENAGINVIAYNEIDKIFQKTHELNFEDCCLIHNDTSSDITKISDKEFEKYKNIDILFAGFPCQGFSNAGKKKSNDPRNTLFKEFLRVAKITNPKYIIGENVKGLLNRKTDKDAFYIDIIKEEFEKIGYSIEYKVLKACNHGIPQKRERLIILGIKKSFKIAPKFPPEEKQNLNLKKIIKFDMEGAIRVKKEDFDMSKLPEECVLTDLENQEDENNVHPYLKLKVDSKNMTYKGKSYSNLLSFGKRGSPIHCEIIDIRSPSKTIICTYDHQPRLFVPLRNKNGFYIRCILPNELKQIQGFPANFEILGSKKQKITQIGNAIPPLLVTKIVKSLMD
jgi:DNA (cytosine-5)-methyltransferase 1